MGCLWKFDLNVGINKVAHMVMYLPSLASISFTFLRLKVGFLRDSGYTHSPPTLRQRVHDGRVLSHLSFRDLHMTQANGSMPGEGPEPEGSGWGSGSGDMVRTQDGW